MKKEILPIVYKNDKSDIWRKVIFFYLPLFLLLAILGITISCFVGLKIKWGIIGLIVTIIISTLIMLIPAGLQNRQIQQVQLNPFLYQLLAFPIYQLHTTHESLYHPLHA